MVLSLRYNAVRHSPCHRVSSCDLVPICDAVLWSTQTTDMAVLQWKQHANRPPVLQQVVAGYSFFICLFRTALFMFLLRNANSTPYNHLVDDDDALVDQQECLFICVTESAVV
ncbi:hypothetical protein DQ04_03471010 [Trypanosoma grayi]|uniref:hypothetical protein n=1 Tax=Trypanosoma grayi TaxID=71804 RepID=UPI0004F412AF|nr:hypothetical protein DQ04_03471010 [Trypanosoma grayi]KEG10641.1 hypothetical protein DQ04_03471010 [Trypanosoma grayi]